MHRKLTITLDAEVYKALHEVIGRGNISQFIEDLLKPLVINDRELDEGYRAMAADREREAEAVAWAEATLGDIADDETW